MSSKTWLYQYTLRTIPTLGDWPSKKKFGLLSHWCGHLWIIWLWFHKTLSCLQSRGENYIHLEKSHKHFRKVTEQIEWQRASRKTKWRPTASPFLTSWCHHKVQIETVAENSLPRKMSLTFLMSTDCRASRMGCLCDTSGMSDPALWVLSCRKCGPSSNAETSLASLQLCFGYFLSCVCWTFYKA